ncbi:sugar ABC transporter substrate-binding protein [Paenibacillus endoradicis]|uniref:sugar ABC transporter substrate-binding protein n=1 Tax=Paenibacillus endoradicis TaxID=2972487 RepID=UPI0021590C2E|nr:ABC transporter substrate-binding protein [Paenibacillus endoradicis]MCR8657079.1 ABC transporter substrate-binding protein [Paenibacillus endoradicis]
MKRTKKLIGMISMMVLVLALAACGNNSSNKSGSEKNGGADTEKLAKISLFQSKVEIAQALEDLADKYKAETGNEVEVWGSAGDSYITQLQTKLAANEGPTIFSVQPGAEAEKFASYYYDMSNEEYVKYISPNMALEIDSKVVGVPTGVEGFGLVYNKALVDPSKITDVASLTAALEQLKADGVNGLSLSQEAYFLIGHIINTPFALQTDPVAFIQQLNKGEVKMSDTAEFQEFAQVMKMIRDNSINPMEVTYDVQMGDFASGKTAIVHQGNWSYSMLAEYDDIEAGMMALPIAGNKKIAVDIPAAWVVNNTASTEQIAAANAFINWLYTSETGKNTIVNEFGFIPAVTTIEATGLDPLSQEVFEATQSGETIPWALNYFPQGIIINDLAPVTSEFFLDSGMTPEQYLEKLDKVWANATK